MFNRMQNLTPLLAVLFSFFFIANETQASKDISDQSSIAEKAVKGVVNISSIKIIKYQPYSPFLNDPFFQHFLGREFSQSFGQPREYREKSLGSGVIVTLDGHILTNNHVVENASEISIKLSDQTETLATVIGKDPYTDLALLKIKPTKGIYALPLGNSDQLRLAEPVMAIGSPFGLGGTVTMGIVSAKGRANVGILDYEDFIQTDAAINPGNSGGALINLKGELVGINTAIFSKSGGYQGIGFAIPINMAKYVMDQLLKNGEIKRGWIGLRYQDVTAEIAKALNQEKLTGAIITHVFPNSQASAAGLKRGDTILRWNNKTVSGASQLSKMIFETPINESVSLTLLRDKKIFSVTVSVQPIPEKALITN